MIEVFFAASQNTYDGILVGAKLIGAILLSVIVLFILLKLIRIAASLINRALYKRYLSKLNADAPKMTFEEYIMSISGVKVFDKPTVAEEIESKDSAVLDSDIKKSDFYLSDSDTQDKTFNEYSATEDCGSNGANASDTYTKNIDNDSDNPDKN